MSIRLKDAIYDLVNLSNTSTTTGNSSVKLYVQNNDEVNFGGTPTNGSTTIYFGYRSVDSRTVPTSYIFGGSTGTATVTANGFKKKDSSDSYVLLGAGGHKAVSDFAVSSHTHTRSQITDFPTSMPASDVYAWAKAATKPSYNFGEIGAGVATIGDGANRIMWRTNASWSSGVYYSTPNNESVVFANKNSSTSWIFATADPTTQGSWESLTPSLQIKNQRVTINKAIATGTEAEYNLDVNGSFNATSGYINKNAIIHAGNIGSQSVSYATSAGSIAWGNVTSRPDMNKYVPKNSSNIAYSDIASKYVGNTVPTYFRITFPDKVLSMWNMVNMEIFIRQSYSDEFGGKILICTHNNSNNTWNPFNASTHGPLTTGIKVYGSGGKYLYIGGCSSYSTISIDKILIGDTATNYDISDISIDYVSSLPSTYQTAKMFYDINSQNISNQSVSYATSSGSAANATNAGYATSAGSATTATSATTAGSANVATIARVLGSDDSMKLYASYSNEVNFGGTNTSGTIYFGYRATDSKPIPTSFIFGSDTGTASITANKFIKKGSSASYVLLGNGDHKAVSDFATSGHTHSQYLTSLPSHSHAYLPTDQVSVEQNSDAYTWIRGYALTDGKLRSQVYNTNGKEWNYWIGMSTSKAYGSILRTSYNDGTPTIQVMGLYNGTWSSWRTCSFEGHTHSYAASDHTHAYLPLSGGTMSGCITTPGNDTVVIKPAKNNYDQIGASDCYFWKIFVTNTYTTNLYIGGEQITFTT